MLVKTEKVSFSLCIKAWHGNNIDQYCNCQLKPKNRRNKDICMKYN